jgi:hypothetical protein
LVSVETELLAFAPCSSNVAQLLLGRPQPDEMPSIFARLGLGGDFWDPQSDSFG